MSKYACTQLHTPHTYVRAHTHTHTHAFNTISLSQMFPSVQNGAWPLSLLHALTLRWTIHVKTAVCESWLSQVTHLTAGALELEAHSM